MKNQDTLKSEMKYNFFRVPNEAVDSEELIGYASMLYMYLCRYADNVTSECYPSYTKLSRVMGISKNTVMKYVEILIEKGLLTKKKVKKPNQEFANNVYTLKPMSVLNENQPKIENEVKIENKVPTESEMKNKKSLILKDDMVSVVDYYDSKENLPRYVKLTDKRKSHIKARLNEYSLEDVKKAIDIANTSKFLNDNLKSSTNWYNMDWIFNPNNFIKILEGKYGMDEKKATRPTVDIYNDIPNDF